MKVSYEPGSQASAQLTVEQPWPMRASTRPLPKHIIWLFIAFAVYIAAPVGDAPILGTSWSAPILYAVALGLFFGYRARGIRRYARWIWFAVAFWLGIAASFLVNIFGSYGVGFDRESLLDVIRFGYWMLAFVITVYVVCRARLGPRMPTYFGAAVVFLACIVLLERLGLDTITGGAISRLTGLSQNAYGWQFSTFTPYLLVPAVTGRGRAKLLGAVGLLLVWGAAAINLSRSSWLGIAVGLAVFLILYSAAHRTFRGLVLFALVGMIAVWAASLAPDPVKARVMERYQTLERLDTDKSYQIRRLMVQKARRLFKRHPIFGVGPSRFAKSSAPLDIPPVLRYAPQSHFDRKSAHNSYALLLAEGGLACTVPFAVLLLILFFRGARAAVLLCRRGEPWALGAYASFVGMSLHLWSLAGLTGTAPWVVYAMVTATIERDKELKCGLNTLRRYE